MKVFFFIPQNINISSLRDDTWTLYQVCGYTTPFKNDLQSILGNGRFLFFYSTLEKFCLMVPTYPELLLFRVRWKVKVGMEPWAVPLAVGRLRPPVALSLCSLTGVVCCYFVTREIRWPFYRPDGRFGFQELDGLYHWNSPKSEAGGSPQTATASAASAGYHPSPHATPYRCHSKKQPTFYLTLLFSFLTHSMLDAPLCRIQVTRWEL